MPLLSLFVELYDVPGVPLMLLVPDVPLILRVPEFIPPRRRSPELPVIELGRLVLLLVPIVAFRLFSLFVFDVL